MGQILLLFRLVMGDLRRRPVQAAIFVFVIAVACATLALGMLLGGATGQSYAQVRAATHGPDLMAMPMDTGPAALTDLAPVTRLPGVTGHDGPYPVVFPTMAFNGDNVVAVVEGRTEAFAPIDQPEVTAGSWVRPGGVVIERSFAQALGVRVGDRISLSGHAFPVIGIAVTAAVALFPFAESTPQGGGPSSLAGAIWMTEADVQALASPQLPLSYEENLKLADPDDAAAIQATARSRELNTDLASWTAVAGQDDVLLRNTGETLIVGGWLLGILAFAAVAALLAGRSVEQTRRVGLLKAVGATPGTVAMVLFAEYVFLTLLADALGLAVAWRLGPMVADPSGGLLTTAAQTKPTGTIVESVTFLAVLIAAVAAVAPTLRSAVTTTVDALADAASPPQQELRFGAIARRLPIGLMLGIRLIVRRPNRATLSAITLTITLLAVTATLCYFDQPTDWAATGANPVSWPSDNLTHQAMVAITTTAFVLAGINVLVVTWTTALDAQRPLAIARAIGATPGQVTAGLATAFLLPAVPGALLGTSLGIGVFWVLRTGQNAMTVPSTPALALAVLGVLAATTAFAAIPARIGAMRSVAETLNSQSA